ncbi:MAG: hypothetical protein Q9169_007149 [Polycauliona sp. 2 TL-2023]
MDMSNSHSMAHMSMGAGIPSLPSLQTSYWAAICTIIGVATLVNVYNKFLYRQRMSAASSGRLFPSTPTAALPRMIATVYAMGREISYASFRFNAFSKPWPRMSTLQSSRSSPTIGRALMVCAELILVLILCFYKLDPNDQWQWESVGYRTGYIAIAQLPLVVLLAGKRNLIAWFTGTSYERLNWLHRWVARILFLTVTIHMGFWFASWDRYDYIRIQLATNPIAQRGFAAWCILLWIVLSSLAPSRRLNYELFVIQHVITFIGFFVAVYLHLPAELKFWIWISVGFFLFDRSVRACATLVVNISLLGNSPKTLAPKATFESLSGDTTRITITNPRFKWKAGQHVFLTCHDLAPLQAHPFTIASLPADGKLEFLVKSKSGSTKRFFRHAEKSQGLPQASPNKYHDRSVLLEGPYGRIRPLRQFDSVFFIAGTSGATFTVPLMRDIVSNWTANTQNRVDKGNRSMSLQGAVTRYVRFIWVIKARSQYTWFASQLATINATVTRLKEASYDVEVDMSIYITCDDKLEAVDVSSGRHEDLEAKHLDATGETSCASQNSDCQVSTNSSERDLEEAKNGVMSIESVSSGSVPQPKAASSCGPNGVCCCKQTIEDEAEATESGRQCHCHCGDDDIEVFRDPAEPVQSISFEKLASGATAENEKIETLQYPSIPMLSGRPEPRKLIRETLEQAFGESAVVVCGPQGLVDDVRRSVVFLSDDRAVHKGTGAQGIYLHTESFGY